MKKKRKDRRRREFPPEPAPPRAPLSRGAAAALACLAAAYLAFGFAFIRSAAPTYDEALHLAGGYSYWGPGRYRLNIDDHPPLAEMWAAVPLLFMRPALSKSHPDWLARRRYPYADFFLNANTLPGELMLNAARAFSFVTLAAILLPVLALWALSLGGPPAAVGALAAAAFCPVLVSNTALVTTDGLSSVLFFVVFFLLSRSDRTTRVWAAAGAVAGLALAAKFNMILLGPLVAGLLLLERGLGLHDRAPESGKPRLPVAGAAAACAAAAVVLLLVYKIGDIGLFWEGLVKTLGRLDRGRSTFLMGEYSNTGFPLYFPVALAVKTPIPTLLLGTCGAVLWGVRRGRRSLWALVPMAGYFAAAQLSRTQIGVRHLLPMMPFLVLAAGAGAAWLWGRGPAGKFGTGVLGLWLAASVLRAGPHQLAYFNEAAGGPARGYEWLIDSNLDWGQGLKPLARVLEGMGNPPIYLSYFGTADPAAYGIRFVPVIANWNVPREGDETDPAASGRVLFAVSATNLQANYIADRTVFDWLKARTPLAVPGHAIFLYDLSGDAEGRARLAALLRAAGHPRAAGLSETLLLK